MTLGIYVAAGIILGYFVLKRFLRGPNITKSIKTRLDGKLVLITGANTGIGKETAKELLRRGAQVVMLCRNIQKANDAIEDIKKEVPGDQNCISAIKMDLSSLKSIREAVDFINEKFDKIDILINNAGVMHSLPNVRTSDGFDMQLGTNHLGHFLLTELLLPKLKKSALDNKNFKPRIVIVSSLAHERGQINWDDVNWNKSFSTIKAYSQSKLANVLHAHELAKRLGNQISVYSLHPGVIATELTRHWTSHNLINKLILPILNLLFQGLIKTPFYGAQTTLYCALEPSIENESGLYYSDCRVKTPAPQAFNDDDANKLWRLSEKLVNLK